ncbi:MAG: nucleoside deaminase [Candidatus Ancillula sp.]|jgi:tRNA(adenine34) deaminase|nr:nucleoside deaminase [Candidatus Ancillula sp.]
MFVRDFDKTPLMEEALLEAHKSLAVSAIPVGAVLLNATGEVVSKAHNTLESPLKHAEMIAIDEYFQNMPTVTDITHSPHARSDVPRALSPDEVHITPSPRDDIAPRQNKLPGFTLITTLEPCIMCAGAIMNAQIDTVIFGAWDEKFGAAGSTWDLLRDPRAPHRVEVFGGVLAARCAKLLQDFFQELRNSK